MSTRMFQSGYSYGGYPFCSLLLILPIPCGYLLAFWLSYTVWMAPFELYINRAFILGGSFTRLTYDSHFYSIFLNDMLRH